MCPLGTPPSLSRVVWYQSTATFFFLVHTTRPLLPLAMLLMCLASSNLLLGSKELFFTSWPGTCGGSIGAFLSRAPLLWLAWGSLLSKEPWAAWAGVPFASLLSKEASPPALLLELLELVLLEEDMFPQSGGLSVPAAVLASLAFSFSSSSLSFSSFFSNNFFFTFSQSARAGVRISSFTPLLEEGSVLSTLPATSDLKPEAASTLLSKVDSSSLANWPFLASSSTCFFFAKYFSFSSGLRRKNSPPPQ